MVCSNMVKLRLQRESQNLLFVRLFSHIFRIMSYPVSENYRDKSILEYFLMFN